MRIVIQRVRRACVRVDDAVVASTGPGLLLLVGVEKLDALPVAERAGVKIANLRIFAAQPGVDDRMDRSVKQVSGEILVVSQFTLYGDTQKGRRPSFIDAARPEHAIPLYERFVALLRDHAQTVATGEFGAMMDVELVNDGPVTLWLER